MVTILNIHSTIKKEAERIVDFYNTNNPTAIANYLGIIILDSNLGNVQGFLQYYDNHFIIHVNSTIESDSARDRVISHELGHYFLHKHLNIFKLTLNTLSFERTLENEADIFSCELLLTDQMIEQELVYIENMNTLELAMYFNLDFETVNKKYELQQIRNFF